MFYMLVDRNNQSGFTLIEIAIVLVIVTVLLGYTVAMFPIQQELKQYRQANDEMDEIIEALIGFAQVNGRLPCPSTTASANGLEDRADVIINTTGAVGADGEPDSCVAYFGFLPSGTLGMNGRTTTTGVLQDPWGTGYAYAVSDVDASGDGIIDFVVANGIRDEGLAAYIPGANPPDLFVCDDSTSIGNHTDCTPASLGNQVAGNLAAVIVSLGKSNSLTVSSNIQRENFDDFDDGTNDKVYVSTSRSDVDGSEFDDVVRWISPNLLFSKMIEADQLP